MSLLTLEFDVKFTAKNKWKKNTEWQLVFHICFRSQVVRRKGEVICCSWLQGISLLDDFSGCRGRRMAVLIGFASRQSVKRRYCFRDWKNEPRAPRFPCFRRQSNWLLSNPAQFQQNSMKLLNPPQFKRPVNLLRKSTVGRDQLEKHSTWGLFCSAHSGRQVNAVLCYPLRLWRSAHYPPLIGSNCHWFSAFCCCLIQKPRTENCNFGPGF